MSPSFDQRMIGSLPAAAAAAAAAARVTSPALSHLAGVLAREYHTQLDTCERTCTSEKNVISLGPVQYANQSRIKVIFVYRHSMQIHQERKCELHDPATYTRDPTSYSFDHKPIP